MSRHRSTSPVRTTPMRTGYKPRHCAGADCLHDHSGDTRPRIRVFPPMLRRRQPVTA